MAGLEHITLRDLSWCMKGGYAYLGSPYSKYELGLDAAHHDICCIAGRLIKEGIPVFAPIVHSHPIAYCADIDALSHDIWLPMDRPLMDAAFCLIVAKMEGWRESHGLNEEILAFRKADKPIFYLSLETFEMSETP
jgi:hypothetical protein